MDVTDNLPEGGTDSALPETSLDNPENWTFFDPDEDNEEATPEPGTEDEEAAEDPAQSENEESEAEDTEGGQSEEESEDGESEEPETPGELNDETEVELMDGEKVPLSELKAGYMRQSGFSRKTMELANYRKEVEAQAERISGTVDVFTEYLAKQIPEEPDAALAMTDPQKYVEQKARYEAVTGEIQRLVELGKEAKAATEEIDTADQQRKLQDENTALASLFPQTTSKNGRQEFFETAFNAGREIGYTDDEMKSVTDHRLLGLAYWARKGMAAAEAKKVAREKVKDVPPVNPDRSKAKARKVNDNKKAMQRLSKTGSIEDAVLVDFD